MNEKDLVINEGDTLVIRAQGIRVRGIVLTARNWGREDGWYVELGDANVPGGYSYWKQGSDGGHIVEHNGIAVDGGTSKE